jgi:hypothetical protein
MDAGPQNLSLDSPNELVTCPGGVVNGVVHIVSSSSSSIHNLSLGSVI